MNEIIKTGDILIISGEGVEAKCKIEKFEHPYFSVIAPANTFRAGKPYHLTFMNIDGLFSGAATVHKMGRPKDPALKGLLYLFNMNRPFQKIQKRRYVRQDCYLDVKMSIKGQGDLSDGKMINISAGGAKIVTNTPYSANTEILIRTKLNDFILDTQGRVLERIDMDKMASAYKFALRIMFIEQKQKNEEAIVKYIFEEYRKKRIRDKMAKEE